MLRLMKQMKPIANDEAKTNLLPTPFDLYSYKRC
jgi:hypothetical protein